MLSSTFMDLVKLCTPSKSVLVRPRDKPWYDSEILKTYRQRDRQKRKAITSQIVNNWTLYKRLRDKVNNLKNMQKNVSTITLTLLSLMQTLIINVNIGNF